VAVAAASLLALAGVLGHLWHWVADVVGRIGDLSPYWLALALALKTAESGLIGLVWRNILQAAYPKGGVSFKTAWGASQGGTAINAIVPAQGGTAAMIGIFRSIIRGSTVSGLASAVVVQSLFFTGVSVAMVIAAAALRPHTVSKGSPSDEVGGFLASRPVAVAAVVVAVIAIVAFVWPRIKTRVVAEWHKAKQGAAIFRDWRRYGRTVALPSAASYVCRMGVNIVFMIGFGVPVTAFTVFLIASSHMLSGLFAITPGGVGQTQALDLVALRSYAPAGSVAAFSITQDSVMTLWNVVLGVGVMLWAFGFTQAKALFSARAPTSPRRRARRRASARS
jgi:uncharacterized membrane protein YbhN (UPF0104 family)